MKLDPGTLQRYCDKVRRTTTAIEMSRRRFLQGSLALASIPSQLSALSDRTRFLLHGGNAIFLLDGVARWVIAPDRFAGNASLAVLCHTDIEIKLRLSGARLAGTTLNFDLLFHTRRTLRRWLCSFELNGATASNVDLVSWLSGEFVRFDLPSPSQVFADTSPFSLAVPAGSVTLDSSWNFGFQAGSIRIPGSSVSLLAGSIALRPAPSGYRSALLETTGKSSLLSVRREANSWGTDFIHLLDRHDCAVRGPRELFASIEFETFECEAGPSVSALFVPREEHTHQLVPPGKFTDTSGRQLSLSLAQPVYAVASTPESGAQASFSSPLSSIHVAAGPSYALVFDNPVSLKGNPVKAGDQDQFDLGLSRLVFENYEDDDTVFEFFLPPGKELDLWHFGTHPPLLETWVRSLWHSLFHRHDTVPLDSIALRVTRPRDFLSLHFTFANMEISVRNGKPWLVQAAGASAPVLTAHFLPQHVQEESFEENNKGGSDDIPPTTPANITLSGPTSLAFNFPLPAEGTPLTVATLLAWPNGAMRRHSDNSNLSDDQKKSGLHRTLIEAPYRLLVDTVETHSAMVHQGAIPKDDLATPELWHTRLVAQSVNVSRADRSTKKTDNVSITFEKAQPGWKSGDTFAVLAPPEFTGTFVLTSVTADQKTVTYTQTLPVLTRTRFTMLLANRFEAYRAIDYAPPIKHLGVSWNSGAYTIQFMGPTGFKPGNLINITAPDRVSVCTNAPTPATTFEIATVPQPDTITFASPQNSAITEQSLVSLLSATEIASISVDPDKTTAHIKTQIPHGLRNGEAVFIAATGTTLDANSLTVQKIEDGWKFTVAAPTPLAFTDMTGKGAIVFTRWFPITADDRRQVVELSSLHPEGYQQTAKPETIHPLAMEQLIFSALGGWASMEGNFTPDPAKSQNVKRFIYRFAQRRDYYVEVDYAGYLWPFAHRAIRIKITQRFFYASANPVNPPANVCYLRTRIFVTIKQKTRNFIAAPGTGLQLPFTRVDILTDSTPALYANPAAAIQADTACSDWFWPSLDADQPFLFQLRGYDSANPPNSVDFSALLIWVSLKIGTTDYKTAEAVSKEYTSRVFAGTKTQRRTVAYGGMALHFAESKSPGDTELHVTSIDFSALLLDPSQTGNTLYDAHAPSVFTVPGDIDPGDTVTPAVFFRPVLLTSAVDIPAVKVFSGQSASGSGQTITVAYTRQFLSTAFNQVPDPRNAAKKVHPNPTEIFVDVQGAPGAASLQYPGPTGGGMAVPTAPITGIARHTGIVADGGGSTWDPTVPGASPPAFNPKLSFDLGNAKLLGCIPLSDAIAVLSDLGASLDLVPSLNVQKIVDTVAKVADTISSIQSQVQNMQSNLHAFNQVIQKQINDSAAALQSKLQSDFNAVTGSMDSIAANTLAKVYNDYAVQLKATLTQMQAQANSVFASSPAGWTAQAVSQSDMDDLRAAADIDLASTLVNAVLAQLTAIEIQSLSNHTNIAVCTFRDFQKGLTKAITAALRPLDPSRLPTQQLAKALDDLVACFDVSQGAPSPSNIRTKALALVKQLRRFFQVLQKAPGALDAKLFEPYLGALQESLAADLKSTVADAKTALTNAVEDHKIAFSVLYTNFNTVYCNNSLPATPTSMAALQAVEDYVANSTALASALNAATDLDTQVNTALNGWADAVAGVASQAITGAEPAFQLLNEAITFIDGLEDLCNTVANLLETPIAVSATYTLAKIPMQDAPEGDPIFVAHRVTDDAGTVAKSVIEIDATVSASVTPDNPAGASASVGTAITLSDFSLQLLPGAPFITVQFMSFQFTAATGQGTHSQCQLDKTNPVFLGDALSFVNEIVQAFAPLGNGAGGAPVIQPSGSGLGVGYSFTVPKIAAGGFQITGLAFEAMLVLSFSGDPLKVRFYLASPQKHFLMSAGIWGGGGFFGLELSSQGVDLVQGCMEFGATVDLDLGVADGEAHILGGIYFEFADRRCILTGFVRAGGSLNILDIIEMSIEFYIGLTYQRIGDQTSVYGTCTVTVSISILFFSADVSMTMNWQWVGSQATDNTATLDRGTPPALYAMLDTGSPSNGLVDDTAIYAPDPASSGNPRLAGWDETMWDTYTAAFMKEFPSHA